jgi:hypothetical protein
MLSSRCGRRAFLRSTAAGAALMFGRNVLGDAQPTETDEAGHSPRTMTLAMLVSYDDEVNASKQQGQELINRLFGKIKGAGFRAVVWRSMRGGEAMFKSREYKDSYPVNLSAFDPMEAAKEAARRFGLEFTVWHEVKGAEAHGWALHSSFVKEHPEFLSTNRLKMVSKSELSWAATEVMRHRVATFQEVLAYEPDAIWIDHVKGGDCSVPIYDADGYYSMGYDKYMVEAFQSKMGRDPWQIPNKDPEWLAFRASFMTGYMRRIRQAQQESHPKVKIGALGASIGYTHSCWYLPIPVENHPNQEIHTRLASPLANLEDHDTWTREGLIDVLCAPHNTFSSAEELKKIIPDAKSHIRAPCLFAVCLGMPAPPAEILDCARVAYEHDASQLLVREASDIFGNRAAWDAFRQVAQRYSKAN